MGEPFKRPECVWNYCPHPEQCAQFCSHARERELDADDELMVAAAWQARKNGTAYKDELAKLRGSAAND